MLGGVEAQRRIREGGSGLEMSDIDMAWLKWLVDRRALIHRELYELLRFMESAGPEEIAHAAEEERRNIFSLLIGAAFSLWRATFLSDNKSLNPTRDWKTVLQSAREFLQILVRDNTIGFPQDRAAREWMVGYYLNNARHRMDRVRGQLGQLLPEKRVRELYAPVQNLADMSSDQRLPKDEWDAILQTLSAVREELYRMPAA